ncbi:MAG: nickel-dependent lactate racemase [Deltaproteobacteria bacterium]|nr:nickel-dependent lactate racemase [Deltaproteobacteria bacterium]
MKKNYFLYKGNAKESFTIPSGWTVKEHTRFPETVPQTPVSDLVRRALAHPAGSKRLSQMAEKGMTVAIIVDDPARATPVAHMLPPILHELLTAGIARENITIVMALGTHRLASQKDLEVKIGKDVLQEYRVVQHDCHAKNLVPIGNLLTGGIVAIDPIVAEAALKIGIGSIFPHPMNGFGGGAKILFPGVADFASISEHHFHYTPEPGCVLGHTENNPFYKEVCRMAEAAGLDFIVNGIFDARERVVDVVAGHYEKAHLQGIEKSKRNYAFHMTEPAHVTLVSADPYTEGPQIMKPVIPASLMTTKPGGAVIVLARCPDGMPEAMLRSFDNIFKTRPEHSGRYAVDAFKNARPMAEGAIDFNCAIFFALVCASRTRITIVSEDLDETSVSRLGFQYAPSLKTAVQLEREMQPKATVNIFPLGGLLLPLLPSLTHLYEFK